MLPTTTKRLYLIGYQTKVLTSGWSSKTVLMEGLEISNKKTVLMEGLEISNKMKNFNNLIIQPSKC